MIDFAQGWTHLGDLGVAVMPTTGLHAHGARKGWSWTTDEITESIAATEEDVAGLGEHPIAAYVLGHIIEDGARELAVVVGEVTRTSGDSIRWNGDLPLVRPQTVPGRPSRSGAGGSDAADAPSTVGDTTMDDQPEHRSVPVGLAEGRVPPAARGRFCIRTGR
ncbi:hypothetical protein ACFFS2_21675 [Streptomyces aurantiacus]|nr:hypothetical protein [Streptomyces aurantiacus]